MQRAEARRVTGLHPLLPAPGAAVELLLEADEPAAALDAALPQIAARVAALWSAHGLGDGALHVRRHAAGASLGVCAPIDQLSGAVDALEEAITPGLCAPEALAAQLEAERAPALRALWAATAHLDRFVDEDGFTLGLGAGAVTWPLGALPDPSALPETRSVPTAYVTGTNGKTTTTRMVSAIATAAGLRAGHTSSDGVVVCGEWRARGDWTGPGAARTLLRAPDLDLGVLETARGGLMRRGLVLDRAWASAVTNISDDHLGEWGLDDLDAMAWAKLTVARATRPGGALIVHGDDPTLARALPGLLRDRSDLRVLRFADGPERPGLDAWATGGSLWWRGADGGPAPLLAEAALPACVGGAVRTMVENALCAALLARELGLADAAVRAGLAGFRLDTAMSRGRLNRFQLEGGAEAVLDFAHNPAGIRGLAGLAARRRGRLLVLVGQAGDRTDALIAAYAAEIAALRPDRVLLKELPHYRRGRAEGEVRALLRRQLEADGVPTAAIGDEPDELLAARRLLEEAQDGDLVLLLIHEEPDAAMDLIDDMGGAALP
jgi:UDP-N-acetylmuramyl tripeptide synthase